MSGLMFKRLMNWFEMVGYARAAQRLAQMGYLKEAKELMIQREASRQTYKELSALSDKELNDIGINRGDIYRIAFGK
jgi:uncharacterized protein YjiS (DUF1127 family)